jgi:hypothetical protein
VGEKRKVELQQINAILSYPGWSGISGLIAVLMLIIAVLTLVYMVAQSRKANRRAKPQRRQRKRKRGGAPSLAYLDANVLPQIIPLSTRAVNTIISIN